MINNSSSRRLVLLGLQQPDGALDGAMQAMETLKGFAMKTTGETKKRDVVRASMSPVGSVIGAKNWEITLPLELKGGGLDGSGNLKPTPLHPALMACGLVLEAAAMVSVTALSGTLKLHDLLTNTTASNDAGTVVLAVLSDTAGEAVIWLRDLQAMPSVGDALTTTDGAACTVSAVEDALVYRPTSSRSEHRTCIIHAHYDGQRRIAERVRGTLQFDWSAGNFCTMQFSLKGLYQRPTNEPLPDAVYSELMPPIGENAGLTLGSYPAADGTIEKLSLQLGNDVVPVADINSPNGRHSFRINARNPTGSIDPESVALSEFDPFALWESGEKADLHATLGDQAGERCSIAVPAARVSNVSDKERAGADVYDLPFEATGKDDDEFYLFFH